MDSDDDDCLTLPVSFYVPQVNAEDVDFSVPPATGEEYLQRVMLEAKQCEAIKRAHISATLRTKLYQKKEETNKHVPCPLAPTLEWQEQQVADFSRLRQRLAVFKSKGDLKPFPNLPSNTDCDGWERLCFGERTFDGSDGTKPLLSILLPIGQPMVDQLLEWHDCWLINEKTMSHSRGRWLYALMACLEQPLHPDTCSTLRSIVRTCQHIRQDMVDPEPSLLASVNLVICLVARYFGQADLADGS